MATTNLIRIALLASAALLILPSISGAVWGMQTICGGSNSTTNGIIPQSPVLGTGSQGVTSVVGMTVVIMLTVMLVTAVLYMVSQVAKIPSLANFVKVELGEMVATAIIIGIFFGGFYIASFAAMGHSAAATQTQNTTLHFNGPGRAVFVSDCVMIGNSSIAMLPPIMAAGVVNYGMGLIDSLNVKITPGGFGFSDQPMQGWATIPNTVDKLQDILAVFEIALLAINFLLGLVYALFPLFLYLGIILRAFPWTRAAGGIFIAMFIGFYVVFPLMLHATLVGFSNASYQNTVAFYNSSASQGAVNFTTFSNTSNNIGDIGPQSSISHSTGSAIGYFVGVLGSLVGFPGGYGVINGYIKLFMGPAIVLIVEIAFCLIVALDFADMLSDILGAPSLSSEGLLNKLL